MSVKIKQELDETTNVESNKARSSSSRGLNKEDIRQDGPGILQPQLNGVYSNMLIKPDPEHDDVDIYRRIKAEPRDHSIDSEEDDATIHSFVKEESTEIVQLKSQVKTEIPTDSRPTYDVPVIVTIKQESDERGSPEAQAIEVQVKVESIDEDNLNSPILDDPGSASEASAKEKEPAEKQHICPTCHKAYRRKSNLKCHIRMHTGETPYKCDQCSKTFRFRSGFNYHMKTHSDKRPHECPICKKTFIQTNILKHHMISHRKEKEWSCSLCKKSFTRNSTLKEHVKVVHNNLGKYVCKICNKTLPKPTALKEHLLTHSNEQPFSCQTCDKKFRRSYTLTMHHKNHHEIFKCCQCKETILGEIPLFRHMKSAHNTILDQSKECICDEKVPKKVITIKHRCVCSVCLKPYARVNLKENEWYYACDRCDVKFVKYKDFFNHKKTVHECNERPKCDYCKNTYNSKKAIKKHIIKVHKVLKV